MRFLICALLALCLLPVVHAETTAVTYSSSSGDLFPNSSENQASVTVTADASWDLNGGVLAAGGSLERTITPTTGHRVVHVGFCHKTRCGFQDFPSDVLVGHERTPPIPLDEVGLYGWTMTVDIEGTLRASLTVQGGQAEPPVHVWDADTKPQAVTITATADGPSLVGQTTYETELYATIYAPGSPGYPSPHRTVPAVGHQPLIVNFGPLSHAAGAPLPFMAVAVAAFGATQSRRRGLIRCA